MADCYVGDRIVQGAALYFGGLIPASYRLRRSFSDFWRSAYGEVITGGKHQSAGKESVETSHIECRNNTRHQNICRFARKTLFFLRVMKCTIYICIYLFFNCNISLVKRHCQKFQINYTEIDGLVCVGLCVDLQFF